MVVAHTLRLALNAQLRHGIINWHPNIRRRTLAVFERHYHMHADHRPCTSNPRSRDRSGHHRKSHGDSGALFTVFAFRPATHLLRQATNEFHVRTTRPRRAHAHAVILQTAWPTPPGVQPIPRAACTQAICKSLSISLDSRAIGRSEVGLRSWKMSSSSNESVGQSAFRTSPAR